MPLAQDLIGQNAGSNPSLALTKLAPPLQAKEWSEHLGRIVQAKPVGYEDHFCRLRARTAAGPAFRRVLLATSLAPAICGMGERTPGENGLTLHPVYGVPYLPGTSLKGILRAWALSQGWEPEWQEGGAHFRALFGERGHQGAAAVVDILDALPVPGGQLLTLDVLTPHFSEYYQNKSGNKPPLGWEGPNPVQFLAASKGVQYRVVLEGDPAWIDRAAEWLALALAERGIGSKSRAGYGHFSCEPLGADDHDELAAAQRNVDARRTKADQHAEVLRRHGKGAVRGEVEKWLLDQPVSPLFTDLLPSPREGALRERLAAVRMLGEEWSFRDDWNARTRNRKGDEKRKERARQLIAAWDGLLREKPT